MLTRNWDPIGTDRTSFQGHFDGAGHTVRGLRIYSTENYQGLFGYIENADIRNLNVEGGSNMGNNASIIAQDYVGALVGYATNNSNIENCTSNVSISGGSNIGGLVGYMDNNSRIAGSKNTANVTGTQYVGGIAGQLYSGGRIEGCTNNGTIGNMSTTASYVGGIGGYASGTT